MPRISPSNLDADGPANVPLVTVAETVVCTLGGVSVSDPTARVVLEGEASVTAGTATTGLTLRIRRGTTTGGALVDVAVVQTIAAGQTATVSVQGLDFPGELAGGSYVLTVQQTAATGNGTCVASNLQAEVS